MSDLQALCQTLESVNQDADRLAADLAERAQRLSRAAGQAANADSGSRRAEGAHAAQALQAASRSAQQAAALLHHAAVAGRAFVSRTDGGSGAAISSTSVPSGDAGLDSGNLQAIYENQSFAFDKAPGRFFLAQGDGFRRVADTMPSPKDGSYLAMIHGSPDLVGVGDATLDAHELALLIRRDPAYREGQAVTLFSCSTGQRADGFAQQLADELAAPVTAPTSLSWLPPEPDGSILITPKDAATGLPVRDENGKGLGGWRRFAPTLL